MALSLKTIIAYLQLKGIGNAKVFAMGNYAKQQDFNLEGCGEILDFLHCCIASKIIKGVSEDSFGNREMLTAIDKASDIIDRSCSMGISTISYFDEIFPRNLRSILDERGKSCSPLVLYVKGDVLKLKDTKSIAVIGTREPTEAGIQAGKYFSERFADNGFNIISGLAIGCDTTAHKGALKAKGLTTAFIAHGLDIPIYPKENIPLAEEIIENGGLIISEYPIGTQLMASRLVERERLQSGLADATLAIQTGIKGGTMHAVRATIANHKPLFMVQYKGDELAKDKVQGNIKLINERLAYPLGSSNFDEALDIISKSIPQKSIPTEKKFKDSLFD
jgi:DNA processing protein